MEQELALSLIAELQAIKDAVRGIAVMLLGIMVILVFRRPGS